MMGYVVPGDDKRREFRRNEKTEVRGQRSGFRVQCSSGVESPLQHVCTFLGFLLQPGGV